jgi:hypothetical protein
MAYQYDYGGDTETTGEVTYQFQDYCILRLTNNQSYGDSLSPYVEWDEAVVDPSGMWDPDNGYEGDTRITISVAGYYFVGAYVRWEINSTGDRFVEVYKNHGATSIADKRIAVNATEATLASLYKLAADDYLQLIVQQTSGSPLAITDYTRFWVALLIGT